MIYPKSIKENDLLGITAISDGITSDIDIKRLNNAKKQFCNRNFKIIETDNVRHSIFGKSASSKTQAAQLEQLYKNKDVKAIFCVAGGDFALEVLSYINFDIIKKNPKWFQGFSDPTSLLFTITTNLDIATIYASNFSAFGMETWHKSLETNLEILKGRQIIQKSFDKFQKNIIPYKDGTEGYNLDEKVYWKIISDDKKIELTGRIIGGCLDVLQDLFGTRFDNTKKFIEKYKNDGIIWYFDIAELTSESLIRILWKFKDNGWFKYTKCILFSRIIEEKSYYDISYSNAIKMILKGLNIKIAIDCCFGHVSPRITIINGAIAKIKIQNGAGQIYFDLK